jgi:hypothetical protein
VTEQTGHVGADVTQTGTGSVRTVQRYIAHPNEVKRLPDASAVVKLDHARGLGRTVTVVRFWPPAADWPDAQANVLIGPPAYELPRTDMPWLPEPPSARGPRLRHESELNRVQPRENNASSNSRPPDPLRRRGIRTGRVALQRLSSRPPWPLSQRARGEVISHGPPALAVLEERGEQTSLLARDGVPALDAAMHDIAAWNPARRSPCRSDHPVCGITLRLDDRGRLH